jgi:suppressor for copper-sensitivity B
MSRPKLSIAALAGLFAALGLWPGGAGPLRAAATAWLDHDHAQVRLVAAGETVGGGELVRLGLEFELAPGWKIYWRAPGDAGFPPSLDWQGSENLAEAAILWPVPHRFSLFGLETFGYGGSVVLPVHARLERPGAAVALRAKLNYLACQEICVPHDGELSLDLPAGPATSSRDGVSIARAESLVPGYGAEAGLSLESAVLTGETGAPLLRVVALSDVPFQGPDLLVEAPPGFGFGKPEVTLGDGGKRAELTVPSGRGSLAEGVLEGKQLTLTVTDGQRGLESAVIARHDRMPSLAVMAGTSAWLTMLGLALLGGLILNLMPCVLPVLSIKLLSVVGQGGRDRGAVRISFLASAAGILFSFLVLAGGALALKAAGMTVGWGIQFQQPLFLSAMALVVSFFAFNLFGWFEIPLPAWVGELATPHGDGGHGLGGHFLAGAFATLLATPCSAPFLGTAVGFALAGGTLEILAIFTALGLGLALPYLLVAALPGLAARLPRPGPWMITLRRVLAVALLGTAVWLLTVLAAQVGGLAATIVGLLLLAVGLLLLAGRRLGRALLVPSVAAVALGAVIVPNGFATVERPAATALEATDWRPFDQAEIARLVGAGRTVFVDITADWCITCQVNKRLVLQRGPVAERLANGEVVTMRGDWTLPSDEITAYLTGLGRYGIPFDAVYGPGAPYGRLLPELLTDEAVLEALDLAAGS